MPFVSMSNRDDKKCQKTFVSQDEYKTYSEFLEERFTKQSMEHRVYHAFIPNKTYENFIEKNDFNLK